MAANMATVITDIVFSLVGTITIDVICHSVSVQFHMGITFIDILEKLEYGFL